VGAFSQLGNEHCRESADFSLPLRFSIGTFGRGSSSTLGETPGSGVIATSIKDRHTNQRHIRSVVNIELSSYM
jgi:hypothetical protein